MLASTFLLVSALLFFSPSSSSFEHLRLALPFPNSSPIPSHPSNAKQESTVDDKKNTLLSQSYPSFSFKKKAFTSSSCIGCFWYSIEISLPVTKKKNTSLQTTNYNITTLRRYKGTSGPISKLLHVHSRSHISQKKSRSVTSQTPPNELAL